MAAISWRRLISCRPLTAGPLADAAPGAAVRSSSDSIHWSARELLAASSLPDLAGSSLVTVHARPTGVTRVAVQGTIVNQGGTTVTVPFEVELYASPSIAIGRYAVQIGSRDDPCRPGAGQSVPFSHDRQAAGHPDSGRRHQRHRLHRHEDRPDRQRCRRATGAPIPGWACPYESSYITITPDQPSDFREALWPFRPPRRPGARRSR